MRAGVVRGRGASGALAEEVLAYTEPAYTRPDASALAALAEDEPHVPVWAEYAEESRARGIVGALSARFAQLRFPLADGISRSDAYRRATLRGEFEAAGPYAPGLALEKPDALRLDIASTIGGRLPVLTAATRRDFEALVCALTERNEPVALPASMGACLVSGLINWDRVARYRRRWCTEHPAAAEGEWLEEFQRMSHKKELYKDRLMILSSGAYSAVEAGEMDLTAEDWLSRSLVIRREHEATHYFTARLFGRIRSHALDELLADFVGLLAAFGRYEPRRALVFLGLEAFPTVRRTGRFVNYTSGVLTDAAASVVAGLVVGAAARLERLTEDWRIDPADLPRLARVTATLASCTLEELASEQAFCLGPAVEGV
jgi:uncharacterized protein DUF7005